MVNRLAKFYVDTTQRRGLRAKRLEARVMSCLLVMVLMHIASKPAFSQQTHIILDDGKVQAIRIELSPGQAYVLTKDQEGSVWTALDPVVLTISKDGQQSSKRVRAGDAAIVGVGEQVGFRTGNSSPARLVVVRPKAAEQKLTVSPFVLTGSLEDASDRNATLLVAISSCHLRDTRNRGDESEWIPSRPDIVTMKSGEVRWIRPGIHHFKNLGLTAAELVSIEW